MEAEIIREDNDAFIKCATLLRKNNKYPMSLVFSEVDTTKAHYVHEAYICAVQLANELIGNGHVRRNAAVFGRISFNSEILFVTNVLVGNPVLCLDIEEKSNFCHMDTIKIDTVFIDAERMKENLDLTQYLAVKYAYIFGNNEDFNVLLNDGCKIYKVIKSDEEQKDTILLKSTEDKTAIANVANFEPEANKAEWLGYNFSSGSTGPAKIQIYKNRYFKKMPKYPVTGMTEELGYWRTIKFVVGVLPGLRICLQANFNMFVMYSIFIAHMVSPARSIYAIVLDQKKSETWATLAAQHRVQQMQFYTPQINNFINTNSFKSIKLSNINYIAVGGSHFQAESRKKVLEAFQKHHRTTPTIKSMYGATELGLSIFQTPWTRNQKLIEESVGKPIISTIRYRIAHLTESRPCKAYEEGEIECFSPLRMFNYWRDRDQPSINWYKTGDQGYVDNENFLYVTGRLKDILILKNAKKINCFNVENIFIGSKKINEICVKGVPNDQNYDDIHAFIYSKFSKAEIQRFVKDNVPEVYQVILHIQGEALPKLPNGKFNGMKLIQLLDK